MKSLLNPRSTAPLALFLAYGCGGGGGGASTPKVESTPTVTIAWPARTRVVGPSSALSCVVTLLKDGPNGTDFKMEIDRGSQLSAFTKTYSASSQAPVGSVNAIFNFYAQPGGSGSVVASASQLVTLAKDGSGLDNVVLTGAIRSVQVQANQSVLAGTPTQLTFSAFDVSNDLVAITPGSAQWKVVSNKNLMNLTADGVASGVSSGNVNVTATVDNIASPSQAVTVLSLTPVYGLNFSPFTQVGQNPQTGSTVSLSQSTSLLTSIKGRTKWVHTYGMDQGLENIPKAAHQMGFKVAAGVNIDPNNESANQAQITKLVAAAKAGYVDLAVVGNEVLLSHPDYESQLITLIQEVKSQLPSTVGVCYCDTWNTLLQHPNVIAAVDTVGLNIYPFY